MAIEQDIYEFQRLAAIFGTSKTAVELGKELVTQLRRAKETLGPRDQTGTLSKGIFAMSPPEGGNGFWSVGVGDKSILGDPSQKAPKGTISEFLNLIRQGYRAQKQKTQQRQLDKIEQKAQAKAGHKQTASERKAAVAQQKRLQRIESKVRTGTRSDRASIARATTGIGKVEQSKSAILASRPAHAKESRNIASQRLKLEKRLNAFLGKYGLSLTESIKAGSNARLFEFLDKYAQMRGNKRGPKRLRHVNASKLRTSIATFRKRVERHPSIERQINTINGDLDRAREKLNARISELQKTERSIRKSLARRK